MPFYNSKKIFEANLLLYSLSLWNILSIVWDLTSLRLELRTPPPSRKFIHRAMSLPDASNPPAGVIEGFHDLRWLVFRNKHYNSSSFHFATRPLLRIEVGRVLYQSFNKFSIVKTKYEKNTVQQT